MSYVMSPFITASVVKYAHDLAIMHADGDWQAVEGVLTRPQCQDLAQTQLMWKTKLEKGKFEGKMIDPTTSELDLQDQPQSPKRPRQENASKGYTTGCFIIKLNKRNAKMCACARKFFKCKCGKLYPEAKYIVDFQCEIRNRTVVKCPRHVVMLRF